MSDPRIPLGADQLAQLRRASQERDDKGAATKVPPRCPCGHPLNDDYMCIDGRIYGPCESEFCGGVCEETWGACTCDNCACKEDA